MSIQYEKEYEMTSRIPGIMTDKAKERYARIHSQESTLKKSVSRYNTHYRKGKAYYNYSIRLPKRWCDELNLEAHDLFLWSIINYDPVILQLRKLEDSA